MTENCCTFGVQLEILPDRVQVLQVLLKKIDVDGDSVGSPMSTQIWNKDIPSARDGFICCMKVAAAVLARSVNDDQRSTAAISGLGQTISYEKIGRIIRRDVELGAIHGSAPLSVMVTLRTMLKHTEDDAKTLRATERLLNSEIGFNGCSVDQESLPQRATAARQKQSCRSMPKAE